MRRAGRLEARAGQRHVLLTEPHAAEGADDVHAPNVRPAAECRSARQAALRYRPGRAILARESGSLSLLPWVARMPKWKSLALALLRPAPGDRQARCPRPAHSMADDPARPELGDPSIHHRRRGVYLRRSCRRLRDTAMLAGQRPIGPPGVPSLVGFQQKTPPSHLDDVVVAARLCRRRDETLDPHRAEVAVPPRGPSPATVATRSARAACARSALRLRVASSVRSGRRAGPTSPMGVSVGRSRAPRSLVEDQAWPKHRPPPTTTT